ncbi:MAG: rhodanese-like domain-containing protein [Bacilli bacterium]|nr:rhodanese-like domain-containing protein [Bacilli bacterium]MBQ6282781.1 rhodanese-like domain-containing protein [Bacilli bacterium]
MLIDIRENYEYRIGHIPNAINISRELLELSPEKYLNKDDVYTLYCDRGIISFELSNKLNKLGFNTKSLKGGYLEYLKLK